MAATWEPTEIIERPGKTKTAPTERYELMGFDTERTITVEIKDAQGAITTQERRLPVRAVRIYSTALLATKVATLKRTRSREDRRAKDQIRAWQAIAYACATDAQRAADRHVAQYEAVTHDLTATIERHEGAGSRPTIQAPRTGTERCRPLAGPLHHRRRRSGDQYQTPPRAGILEQASFILIRTKTPGWTITDTEMIDPYRQQYVH